MKQKTPLVALFLLCALFFNFAAPVLACGPSSTIPVFAFETRPDLELENYAAGRLGIVRPDYNRSFLLAAYRHIAGAPFSAFEQKELVKVWNAELYREDENTADETAAVKNWIAARKKIFPDEPEPKIYSARQWDGGYDFFPNCTANAFVTAVRTLDQRSAAHGAASDAVKDWTRAQDAVFGNCYEGKNTPAETAPDAPAWLKKDRAYQIAAASFYATDFETAKNRFAAIAADKDSVWQPTANYLVVRTIIRQASAVDENDVEQLRLKRRPFYEEAQARLQQIAGDASQRDFHEAAARLINLVKYRLQPAERLHELASILTAKSENKDFRQNLIDYRWLMDRHEEFAYAAAEKNATEAAKKAGKEYASEFKVNPRDYSAAVREDDVTDWIFTFQSETDEAFEYALKKWQGTDSTAWFLAAIAKAKKDSAQSAALIAQAEKIEKNSPAFITAAFHQNRLLMETGKPAEARAKLDFLLTNRMTVYPTSARNAFLAQRMMLAQNLDEFLQFAERRAAAFAIDGSPYYIENFKKDSAGGWEGDKAVAEWQNRAMFDQDAVKIFNDSMPLAVLRQAALNTKVPPHLRRTLLIAAWTRAILLGDEKVAQELAPTLGKLAPETNALISSYSAAKTSAERQNAVTYLLLKLPQMRPFVDSGYGRLTPAETIDSYRDNWWCAPQDFYYNSEGEKAPLEVEATPAPAFLTAANLAEASRERDKLKSLGGGSTYLARRAEEFVAAAPTDARLAESLHLAVRATRYGCQDCDTGKYSKAAHDALKKLFPRSDWAKKTPYWFKDKSCGQQ